MLAWIIQISLISLIFIFLVHHLIGFFKTTLTVPKIRDLVNSPSQKYKNIFDTINTNMSMSMSTISLTDNNSNSNSNSNSYTAIDLLPSSPHNQSQTYTSPSLDDSTKDMMKDELKSFLKKQLNTNDSNSTFPANNSFQNNNYFS
jgi:hypothetical protein